MRLAAIIAVVCGCQGRPAPPPTVPSDGRAADAAVADARPADAAAPETWTRHLPAIRRDLPARGAEVEHRAAIALDRTYFVTLSEEVLDLAVQSPFPAPDWLTRSAVGSQPYPFGWPISPTSPRPADYLGHAVELTYLVVFRTDRHDDPAFAPDGMRLRTTRAARFRGWAFVYDVTGPTRLAAVQLDVTGSTPIATLKPGVDRALAARLKTMLADQIIATTQAQLR